MKKVTILFFYISILFTFGCKKNDPEPQKYEFYSTDAYFSDESSAPGFCGWLFVAIKADGSLDIYKPVYVPLNMLINEHVTYEAKIEVLPETYKCKAGKGDPNFSRGGTPESEFHFCNILEYKRK